MPVAAVTLDFHNTLARCDAWFELEVREVAPTVLQLLAARDLVPDDAVLRERARAAYRALRLAIVDHGEEQDALACTVHALAAVGVTVDEALVANLIAELMRATLPTTTPLPGALAAIHELHAAGYRLGVVSNAVYHPFIEWTLDQFAIAHCFGSVISSASGGYYKSRPELYRAAVAELGVDVGTTVHVGDSYRFDVVGAARAGLRTVWYNPAGAAPTEPGVPTATIADLAELPALVARLARD